jgi:hypothetical protein
LVGSHCDLLLLFWLGFGCPCLFWYSFRIACMVDCRSALGLLMVYRSRLNSTMKSYSGSENISELRFLASGGEGYQSCLELGEASCACASARSAKRLSVLECVVPYRGRLGTGRSPCLLYRRKAAYVLPQYDHEVDLLIMYRLGGSLPRRGTRTEFAFACQRLKRRRWLGARVG